MPDISMCGSRNCPWQEDCLRSPASGTEPWRWQTWGSFMPKEKMDKPEDCKYFIPVEKGR